MTMAGWSQETVLNFLQSELVNLAEFGKKKELETENSLQETLEFLRGMVSQVPNQNSGSLLLKTPKVNRKIPVQRIETIHEDESVEFEVTRTTSIVSEPVEIKVEDDKDDDNSSNRRSRRTASKRAASSIKQQQTATLKEKLRKPSKSDEENEKSSRKQRRESSTSSDEEQTKPVRQSRTKKASIQKTSVSQVPPVVIETIDKTYVMEAEKHRETLVESKERESVNKRKHDETRSPSPQQIPESTRSSSKYSEEPAAKKRNVIIDSLEKSSLDDTLESSIYEDAIGKPAPIHNSTKIGDTTVTFEPKVKELSKISDSKSKEFINDLKSINNKNMNVTVTLETLPKYMQSAMSEDDTLEDEDLVSCTPEVKNLTKNVSQMGYRAKVIEIAKQNRKPNALFSPYATDSVKKRVEAFEQVVLSTPKPIEADVPTRVTRTKTRAMAAAEASNNSVQPTQPVQSISQKLARRSLAKAKKIALARTVKEFDDVKENENLVNSAIKPNRLLANNEKLMQKLQLRITPIGKSRLQQPMSVNRLQHTPLSVQPLSSHSRAMSASRTNIIMSMDSFIPSKKDTTKLSAEKSEDKKRRANEEDARKKKEEVLKAHMEEKKRKREEKERKNRLAREARDKLEMEKRIKTEKEREEKAKIALQIQEKQREENEKKKQLQLQRAQEKEEKRRQEEQLRLQRLQEQEEMERQYAEQKRKEQEAAEKQHQRRIAEAKAQQQALAEAAKMKVQYQTKTTKLMNTTVTKQMPPPASYKIESEPDEDDTSDNEEAPKHTVPYWATAEVRKTPLELQTYIKSYEVHRYFDSRQCTPDLTKIFQGIDKRRLKRTSSAIWKTPPRYSMMYNE